MTVPRFPLIEEPGEWDELTLVVATTFLEAEGEPDDGKLAVAYVIENRRGATKTAHQVILGADGRAYEDGKPYEAWSCWNDNERVRARARLSAASDASREACWRAAAAARWRLLPDPTAGATMYLNVSLTLKIRGGTLPAWAAAPGQPATLDESRVLAVIGRHHFLKA